MYTKITAFLLSASLLSGCSVFEQSQPYIPPATNLADSQLLEAASSISHSLVNLSAIAQDNKPSPLLHQPDPRSYGMGQIASIDWSGPLEQIVDRIAQASGYRVQVTGEKPAIPVLITVNARQQMLGTILRNAAFQAGSRAKVVLYPEAKMIDLIYTGH